MKKQLRNIFLVLAMGAAPLCLSPVLLNAQQVNEDQQAYQAGYQQGINDAQNHRAINMNTDDWHGTRLSAYQQGYQEGYNGAGGYSAGGYGRRDHDRDAESQRAYQAGYDNGARDAQRNRSMNMNTDDWHGERLQAYRQGYEQGYRRGEGKRHRDRDHDDDDR